ncbi:MAG TPA: SDR family NAD(P)-dependent oxidoreductase [Planctomycetaceae bacterium]|nr:SDR family NAD(P)-dependent oxidoreductase [Planctomycetaceae bacterium]
MKTVTFASLMGCRAVVTGSTSGIGRAIATEFARAGADVLVHGCRNTATAESLAEEFRKLGRQSAVLMADLSRESELSAFVDHCWSKLGSIDVWVNNAGVDLLTGDSATLDFSQKLQRLYEVDVRGTLLLSRLIGEKMVAAGGGVILNIGWDQAERGMEGDSGELFAAAKSAIMGFTRSLAVSLAPKVRVNCIAPGWIQTKWGAEAGSIWQERVLRETPLQRWGTPEDIAAVARFLASREASYLTGQVIYVNGGAER